MSQSLTVIVPIMRIAARELKLTTDRFSFHYWFTIFHVTGSSSFQPARLPIGPTQPPTPPTAILNPMMGQISVAYTARASRDLSLCSLNMYSYESEWAVGADWWMGRGLRKNLAKDGRTEDLGLSQTANEIAPKSEEAQDVVRARISTSSVRNNITLRWWRL